MSEKIMAWFEKRRQSRAMQLMQSHLALTTAAVDELVKAVNAKAGGDEKAGQESIARLSTMEMEADTLRRDIWHELAKGDVPASERDDLLHLSKRLDQITDWARESARILLVTPLVKMPSDLTALCKKMVEKSKECTWAVRKSVDALGSNLREALNLADKVERLEEDADELYNEARRHYAHMDQGRVTVGEAILMAQLLDAVENVSDWCENTIDQVRVIAVRML